MDEFVLLEHTADLRFRATSNTLEGALTQAAKGLIAESLGEVRLKEDSKKTFSYEYASLKELVHDFLSDVLFSMQFEDYAPVEYDIKIDSEKKHMKAETRGTSSVPAIRNEIKAVTYHQMVVEEKNSVWSIEAVCDI